jgi:hypothetical protein
MIKDNLVFFKAARSPEGLPKPEVGLHAGMFFTL